MRWPAYMVSALLMAAFAAKAGTPDKVQTRERINPFARPLQEVVASAPGSPALPGSTLLNLKAVMPSPTRPLANINGQVLEVGEVYLNYELIAVSASGVTLMRGSERIELTLHPVGDSAGSLADATGVSTRNQ